MATLLDVRNAIELKGQASAAELARQLQLSAALLEGMLFHLEQRGLIEPYSPPVTAGCAKGKCQGCKQQQQSCAASARCYRIKSH